MAPKVMYVQEQIRNQIVENFLFGSNGLGDEDSLLEHGVVDSTGVLELVLFVEEAFGIGVDDNEILPENFDSIGSLARYVTSKQASHRRIETQPPGIHPLACPGSGAGSGIRGKVAHS